MESIKKAIHLVNSALVYCKAKKIHEREEKRQRRKLRIFRKTGWHNIRPLYDRWMIYRADLEVAERMTDERDRMRAVRSAGERFKHWPDTYR